MTSLLPVLALPYPMIDPVLVAIGPVAIRWYALSYIAGIVLGWWAALRMVRREAIWAGPAPVSPAQIDDFIVWVTLGIILGGRIGYILFYGFVYQPDQYADPNVWWRIWEGGMSFHGGLIGVIVAIIIFALLKQVDMVRLGDIVACVTPIGLFFGRIANFINGELYGRVTDVPWAMVFPQRVDATGRILSDPGPLPRHPSQLYEALLEGVVIFLILQLLARRFGWAQRRGALVAAFLALYAAARSFCEIFRDSDQLVFGGAVSMGQLLSAFMLAGAVLFAWIAWRDKPAAA